MDEDRDRQFVEYIIKSIVTKPEKVEVNRTVDELGVLLTVKVDAEDMGLLIGRNGSTAKSIRTLARIVGMRNNARVNLRIEEPPESDRKPRESASIVDESGKSKDIADVLGDLQ